MTSGPIIQKEYTTFYFPHTGPKDHNPGPTRAPPKPTRKCPPGPHLTAPEHPINLIEGPGRHGLHNPHRRAPRGPRPSRGTLPPPASSGGRDGGADPAAHHRGATRFTGAGPRAEPTPQGSPGHHLLRIRPNRSDADSRHLPHYRTPPRPTSRTPPGRDTSTSRDKPAGHQSPSPKQHPLPQSAPQHAKGARQYAPEPPEEAPSTQNRPWGPKGHPEHLPGTPRRAETATGPSAPQPRGYPQDTRLRGTTLSPPPPPADRLRRQPETPHTLTGACILLGTYIVDRETI